MSGTIPEQQSNTPAQSPEELERARMERDRKADGVLKERFLADAEAFLDANKGDPKKIKAFLDKVAASAEGWPETLAELKRHRNAEAMKLVRKDRKASSEPSKGSEAIKAPSSPEKREQTISQAEFDDLSKNGSEILSKTVQAEAQKNQEIQREYVRTYGQLLLLRSTGEAYRDYLTDIGANIRFKSLSDKPVLYAKQEAAIASVLASIDATLSDPSPQKLKSLDLKKMVDTVFMPETELTSGRMNQPMIEYDTESGKASLNNPLSLEETESRYARMKALILEGNGKTDPFDTTSVKTKKLEMLGLLRKNDSRDDDPTGLNSGNAIRKQVEDDVLSNPTIRKNPDTAKVFDALLKVKYDPQAVKEFSKITFDKSAIPDSKKFDAFFRAKGIVVSPERLAGLVATAWEVSAKRDSIIADQVKGLDENIALGTFPKAEAEAFAKDKTKYVESRFENFAGTLVLESFRRETMNDALSRTPDISSVRKSDEALKLYTNVEGIGGKTSDSVTNSRIRMSEWIGEQLTIMYISWGIGNAVGNTSRLAAAADGAGAMTARLAMGSTRLEPWAKGIGIWATRTLTEGIPFAVSYSTLDGLAKEGFADGNLVQRIAEITKNSNTPDGNLRIVAFLGVIKSMAPFLKMVPSPKEWVSAMAAKAIPGLAEKMGTRVVATEATSPVAMEKIAQAMQNVTLDTTALLGADTVIRFAKGEELPKNPQDIPNYIAQEISVIIPFAIGLRAMSKNMTHNANEPIRIEIRGNGDAVVSVGDRTAIVPKDVRQAAVGKDVSEIRKDIRRLEQTRNILRNKGKPKEQIHAVSDEITAKKQELKATRNKAEQDGESASTPVIVPKQQDTTPTEEFAGSGSVTTKHAETRSPLEDPELSKTSTNHTAKWVVEIWRNLEHITLSETVSGFDPAKTAEWKISEKFQELVDGMKNIESEALLRTQAETVVRSELKRYHDEISKNYDDFSPESKRVVDEWRKNISSQAERLANEYIEAVKAKMRNEPMKDEWWDIKYLEKALESTKKEIESNKELRKLYEKSTAPTDIPI